MVPLVNPYVAGNPVGDSPAFVGRTDVLREVLRILRRPQDNALVLYGQRRIGKTSILEHLASWLPREGDYKPVYFDLQDKATWTLGRVLDALAASIAEALGKPSPELGDDPKTSFRDAWLPAILGDLTIGTSLVLLFDEFDVLAYPESDQAGKAFFPYLRDLLSVDSMRLQFVFVIGRNVDDLDTIALSVFKGTDSLRVSLLAKDDAAALVRLSEANGSLSWGDDAVALVWELTHGHPFLTQQLCSHVWESAHDEPEGVPTASRNDVDAVVDEVLDASQNALEWLWDGLPAAERVVISALAEAGPGPITTEALEQCLHESGVRVVIRDLQNAPRQLQEWDVLEPDGGGLRFRVELLRRWLVRYKPLRRVQEEMDHIAPVAQNFYQAGLGFYRNQQLEEAIDPLQKAISLNPNHQGANQLLAEILIAKGNLTEAKQILERLYEFQPAAARPRLVQVLLAFLQDTKKESAQLALCDEILRIEPGQPKALVTKRKIWTRRGDIAYKKKDFYDALQSFMKAGATAKAAIAEERIRRYQLKEDLVEIDKLNSKGNFTEALDKTLHLSTLFPDHTDWDLRISDLRTRVELANSYRNAIKELREGKILEAQQSLVKIVTYDPMFRDASRYLHIATNRMKKKWRPEWLLATVVIISVTASGFIGYTIHDQVGNSTN